MDRRRLPDAMRTPLLALAAPVHRGGGGLRPARAAARAAGALAAAGRHPRRRRRRLPRADALLSRSPTGWRPPSPSTRCSSRWRGLAARRWWERWRSLHPSLTLGLIAVSAVVATLANRLLPSREPPPVSALARQGLALGPFLRGLPLFVFLAVVFTGVSWGTVDTALPPRLVQLGSRAELWGALAALLSVTSAIGGLLYASVARPATVRDALGRSLLFLALWSGAAAAAGLLAGGGEHGGVAGRRGLLPGPAGGAAHLPAPAGAAGGPSGRGLLGVRRLLVAGHRRWQRAHRGAARARQRPRGARPFGGVLPWGRCGAGAPAAARRLVRAPPLKSARVSRGRRRAGTPVNVVPLATVESTQMRPPWAWTMLLDDEEPQPDGVAARRSPSCAPRSSGWKSRGNSSAGMGLPRLCTSISTSVLRRPGAHPHRACPRRSVSALFTRLVMSCASRSPSHSPRPSPRCCSRMMRRSGCASLHLLHHLPRQLVQVQRAGAARGMPPLQPRLGEVQQIADHPGGALGAGEDAARPRLRPARPAPPA